MSTLIEEYTGTKRVGFRVRDLAYYRSTLNSENQSDALIVFEFFQGGSFVRKIASILLESIKLQVVYKVLALKGITSFRVAIYPDLNNPRVIYELKSPAELYVEENVLPPFGEGVKGRVKQLLRVITGFNPSISAVGLVIRN